MLKRKKYTPEPVYTMHGQLTRSTAIRSYSYDEKNQILKLNFIKGGEVRFRDVPLKIVNDLTRASSAGSYYHTYIKPTYQTY